MQTVKIEASSRTQSGKGGARRLRNEEKIPAILYGRGKEARSLSVSPKELTAAFGGKLGRNVVLALSVDGGESETTQMVDYQVHPVSRNLLHVDFRIVSDETPVSVKVPLRFVGKPKGAVMGGILRQVYRELPVTCVPSAIPEAIVFDVSGLDVEDIVSAGELTLPEGVTVTLNASLTVGGVYGSRQRTDEAEGEEEEEKS